VRVHSFRLDDDLYTRVLVMSEVDGITVSELVRQALIRYLYEEGNDDGTV
jgi:predicted DNA-binding protein